MGQYQIVVWSFKAPPPPCLVLQWMGQFSGTRPSLKQLMSPSARLNFINLINGTVVRLLMTIRDCISPLLPYRTSQTNTSSVLKPLIFLSSIQARKSVGPDEIPNWSLKNFAPRISHPVSSIFNSSINERCVPSLWKYEPAPVYGFWS